MYWLYDTLKSKKLGVQLGFATTALLIFGSLLMNFMPAYYRGLQGEDINFFFEHVSLVNAWFYLMFAGFVLYGINTFCCTLDSVLVKLRAGVKNVTLYGGSVVHVAFMVTLVAHLVGGVYYTPSRMFTITGKPVRCGDAELSVTGIETITFPNGMPKEVRATIHVKRGGEEFERILGYNQPVVFDMGAKEFLLRQYGSKPKSVTLNLNGSTQKLALMEEFSIGESRAIVAGLMLPPRIETPVVAIVANPNREDAQQYFVRMDRTDALLIEGVQVRLEDVEIVNSVVVDLKENPGVPLALSVTALFGVGVVLVIFRLVQKLTHRY
ncbi:MAG: hypothetical protein V3V45_00600 [Candidatus Brocadiales bacterium]